jgi:ATP-dependent helicase Lhr and Lhr-like helicase
MNSDSKRQLRQNLPVTWLPFFGRFGGMTEIQLKVIPKILNDMNVVIASPTASGKTEAVAEPSVEQLFSGSQTISPFSIVYVVPTRALANDTYARLADAIQASNLICGIKHGDKPNLQSRPPHFLITTPESLDSLICRRPNDFGNLKTLIIDEIHLLDNTYRGDQIRLLIRRLRELRQDDFRIHLLSATLKHPENVARRYMDKFEIIDGGAQRTIRYDFKQSHEDILRLAQANRWKKLLYFCNKREMVEDVAAQLRSIWEPYPVRVHHGSLDRRIREETEYVMKTARVAVCVSTSTLEVGIDIGNIDAVVIADVPWSLASLQQRIGRGNRRQDFIQVIGLTENVLEEEVLRTMLEAAIEGEISEISYKADLSVAVQQVFSYLFQNPRGATTESLMNIISPLCSDSDTLAILKHLAVQGFLGYENYKWFADTEVMNMGDKGKLHSNIPDTFSYQVVDTSSGKKVGSISSGFDAIFVLAKQAWRVTRISGNTVFTAQFHGQASSAMFQKSENRGAFFDLLPPFLQEDHEPDLF